MSRVSLRSRLLLVSAPLLVLASCAPAALRVNATATVYVQTTLNAPEVRPGYYRRPGPSLLITDAMKNGAAAGSYVYPILLPSGGAAQLLRGSDGRYPLPPLNNFNQIFTVISRTPLKVDPAALAAARNVMAVGDVVNAATTGLNRADWNVSTNAFWVAEFGGLLVNSFPAGAEVSVGGQRVGETPLRLDDVDPGRTQVSVSAAGRLTVNRTVTVAANETSVLRIELPRRPITTGVLSVSSTVPASVSIDGRAYGSAPVSVRVEQGGHDITVTAASGSKTLNVQLRPGANIGIGCQSTEAGFDCTLQ